jgi:hypothetical protein
VFFTVTWTVGIQEYGGGVDGNVTGDGLTARLAGAAGGAGGGFGTHPAATSTTAIAANRIPPCTVKPLRMLAPWLRPS